MILEPGQRLPGLLWSHYQIDRLQSGEAYSPLYVASKVLFNHRYEEQEFYESAQDEWLPVWVRATVVPASGDDDELQSRVRLLRYEMDSVLSGNSAWMPRALDWLEQTPPEPAEEGNGDQGNEQPEVNAAEWPTALLVFSRMIGRNLREAEADWADDSILRVRFLTEWLNFLQTLHDRKQCLGAVSPEEIVVDGSGQFQIMATDRVLPLAQTELLRWYFPPERYPASFAAPELQDKKAGFDYRSDLFNWGCLAVYLIGGIDLFERAPLSEEPLTAEETGQLTAQLENLASRYLAAMKSFAPGRSGNSEQLVVAMWKAAIEQSLKLNSGERPGSISGLRNVDVPGRTVHKVAEKFKSWFRPVERKPE